MMNYEELYEALSASEKELNDTVKAAANQTKALIKNTEAGNITELRKTANIFLDTAARLQELGRWIQKSPLSCRSMYVS